MPVKYQDQQLIIFESALFRTTSTLIIGNSYLLLIDPTWLPNEIKLIAEHCSRLSEGRKKYLLFTHSDYDHIIAYGRFKEFTTIASKNFTTNTNETKESILEQIRNFDDQYYINRTYRIEYPKISFPISKDNSDLTLGDHSYQFYQGRGHNVDGLISLNKTLGILIVGDYLSNIEFPYIYDSLAFYKATLSCLEEIISKEKVNILISGHGDYATDTNEMRKRIEDSKTYLNALEAAVFSNKPFNLSQLFPRYKYQKIMTKFHEANLALVKQDLMENS